MTGAQVHIHTVQVEWGDRDPSGIVSYPNFPSYFDTATWAIFYAADLSLDAMRGRFDCLGIPLVDAQASFKSPCRFRDVLTIESQVTDVTEKTMTVRHRLLNGGREASTGREIRSLGIVHPDGPLRLKAVPLPMAARQALGI